MTALSLLRAMVCSSGSTKAPWISAPAASSRDFATLTSTPMRLHSLSTAAIQPRAASCSGVSWLV
eukprot:5590491-Lingulodinium_polyedra.AAC.1